ncbi:hypothetical protein DBR12_13345 [Acidovorax sp. HMWF029]|uniref:hypothetical protein n=1 Tax=Acidovorax sp. HMWF029 TaxID=2056863 RepID=UPI000D341215|nr:hypothetical protein [Acidovorax sp. HMWF029]PTT19069.1 hypothetical protein DBR12_13345 [Acidovorax sp. HMWF029]
MKYLRRCLKALGWLMLALGGLVAVWLAALIAANWNDDALTEAAQRALQYTPPTEQALEGNGYLILMGLDAPTGGDAIGDAMALGRQRLAREIERRRWVEAHGDRQEGMPPSIPAENAGNEVLPDRLRCPVGEADCFAWFVKHGDEVQTLAKTHQTLLQRLAGAASAPQFDNPSPYYLQAELPPYGRLVRAHELWLAQAALAWVHGQPQQAMDIARQATQLRSRLASHSNSLIASMIALAMQHRELRWLSNASARGELQTLPEISKEIEELLSMPTKSLGSAMYGEIQFVASGFYLYKTIDLFASPWGDPSVWWQRAFNKATNWAYLPQQTLNLMLSQLQKVQAISGIPAQQQSAAFSKLTQQLVDNEACLPWKSLRNIAGTCLAVSTAPSYQSYFQRVADIDGYRRLVLLQHRAAVENVAPADMPAWLAQSPQALRNPYTLEPMQWDAATRSLVFEGREKQNQNPDQSPTYRIRLRS